MATKQLGYQSLPSVAIAENATSPNPGQSGVWAWSTTLGRPVCWNGTNWVSNLSSDMATEITATKTIPTATDRFLMLDSAADDAPVLMTFEDFKAAIIASVAPVTRGIWDYWYDFRAANNTASASDVFTGAAIGSGTNNTAVPTTGMAGFNPYGIFLRSSTTANSGYRYQTAIVNDYFGAISHKFRCQYMPLTAFTTRLLRIGFHDTTTNADATDGAYFEINGDVCSAKTANNSTRTTHATTLTLSLNTAYTFEIDVNAAGTIARFRVFAGTSTTAVLDVTITTNIPTTSARAFGAGIVATEASTTATDIGILYSLGVGTIEGYNLVNAGAAFGDILGLLQTV